MRTCFLIFVAGATILLSTKASNPEDDVEDRGSAIGQVRRILRPKTINYGALEPGRSNPLYNDPRQ